MGLLAPVPLRLPQLVAGRASNVSLRFTVELRVQRLVEDFADEAIWELM